MAYPLDAFYSRIYRQYDLINRLFTLGMDQSWRKHTIRWCLREKPANVLDICCGTGDLTLLLASEGGAGIAVTGFDRNAEMLWIARRKSARKNKTSIRYVQGDASKMPFDDNSFDCITCGFGFRNLTFENPQASVHISEMHRVLRQGGKLFILESGMPENLLVRFFFRSYLYLVMVPIAYLLSGDHSAYRYLARSSANFFTAGEMDRLLSGEGFTVFDRRDFFMGAASLTAASKP